MPPVCTQTHISPSPACSPLTLFLWHYLTLIKCDWITQESCHQLVYSCSLLLQREHFFFFSRVPTAYRCVWAFTPQLCLRFSYLFFPLFCFLLGCFTHLKAVYFGEGWHCKKGLFGRRQVGQVCVSVCVHSSWLTLAGDDGGLTGKGLWEHTACTLMPLTRMAALYVALMAAIHCAHFS